MLRKTVALVVLGLLVAVFVSYAFAQCNVDKLAKGQKPACAQSCCCCDDVSRVSS